jgi:protein-tyrosine phosphatase
MKQIKILFVCLGNICRSPMAEGIMAYLVSQRMMDDVIVCDSAGTASYHIGKQPDDRTLRVCANNNVQLNHRARAFTAKDFDLFDYIIAMDATNKEHILRKAPYASDKQKVYLMRDFDSKQTGTNVHDPYYDGIAEFERVFDVLQDCCANLLQHITTTSHYKTNCQT